MKTPSASKHRLAAGRNLPKLDRYNGYSHQSHQDRLPDRSELGAIWAEQNDCQRIQDVNNNFNLQPQIFYFDVYDFDHLWKAIKIFVLITAKQKVWNICLSMTRVDGPTGSHYRAVETRARNIFDWALWDIYNVTMSIVSSQVPTRASLAGPPRQHIGTNAPRHHYFPFFSASFCREEGK